MAGYAESNYRTQGPRGPSSVGRERERGPLSNPSIAPTTQTVRSTNQKIHSYTNAHRQHLQEKIPPNKPYIGLRPAYRPGYAICVMLAGGINLISGILMTALSYSRTIDDPSNVTARVLRILGPVLIVIGFIFLLCGLILFCHYRQRKKKEKWARDHGQPPLDTPHRRYRKQVPRQYQDSHGQKLPVQLPLDNYSSHYGSTPRRSTRSHGPSTGSSSRKLQRPLDGDWKYVSDIRDVTATPKPYPREERRRIDAVTSKEYKMYPYDRSFKNPYEQATAPATDGGARSSTRSAPRTSSPSRSRGRDDRRY